MYCEVCLAQGPSSESIDREFAAKNWNRAARPERPAARFETEMAMGKFKMPPKPRLMFCWECSRRLYGTIHAVVVVDDVERIVRKSCKARMERDAR
jgi:hypothetical protein